MSFIVTTPDGVEHDYIDGADAATELAAAYAEAFPGAAVTVTAPDGTSSLVRRFGRITVRMPALAAP